MGSSTSSVQVSSSSGGSGMKDMHLSEDHDENKNNFQDKNNHDNSLSEDRNISFSSLHSFPPTRRRCHRMKNPLLDSTLSNIKSLPLLPSIGTRVSSASSSKRSISHHHHHINNNTSESKEDEEYSCPSRLPHLNSPSSSPLVNTCCIKQSPTSSMNNQNSEINHSPSSLTISSSTNPSCKSKPISIPSKNNNNNNNSDSTSPPSHHQKHSLMIHHSEDSPPDHPTPPKIQSALPLINSLINTNSTSYLSPPRNNGFPMRDEKALKSRSTNKTVSNQSINDSLLQVTDHVRPLHDLIRVPPRHSQSHSLDMLEEYLPRSSAGHLQLTANSNEADSKKRSKQKYSSSPTIEDRCYLTESQIEQRKQKNAVNIKSKKDPFQRIGNATLKNRESIYGDFLSPSNFPNQKRNSRLSPECDCEISPPLKGLDAILMNSSRTLTNHGNDDISIYVSSPTSAPEIIVPSKSIANEKKKRLLVFQQKHVERRKRTNHLSSRRSHSVIGIVHR